MNKSRHLFTSESVAEGHPDKVADQISDAVLDACLEKDPKSRVAIETLVTTGLAFVAGELTTEAYVDIPSIVRGTIKSIGYTEPELAFDWEACSVITSIQEQTLSFIPKLFGVMVVFLLAMPWMLRIMTSYTAALFSGLARFASV